MFALVVFIIAIINPLGCCAKVVTKRSTNLNSECGFAPALTGQVYNDGTTTTRNQFPWITAVYKQKNGRWKFICGGSLVSSQHVVTAAHCIQEKDESSATSPKHLRLLFGGHDLSDEFEEGRILIGVKKYKVHNEWDSSTYDYEGDIAVLLLNGQAPFSRFIRPVCVSENNDMTNMNSGTLAGWGQYDDSEQQSNLPRKIDLDVIPNKQCFKLESRLKLASGDGMFCAGKKGVAVCSGDSGSGLYVNIKGKFYLRGLVSSSVRTRCSEGYVALYTDVLKYLDFISTQLTLL